MTEATNVWLVLCINGESEQTYAFSTYETACGWADKDDRAHVIFSRTLDHPEIADMVTQ